MPVLDIGYNSQRDNDNFGGKFPGFSQCFSTSVWMLMSFYSLEIDALDDSALAKYVDDVEASVGTVPGLAEEMQKQDHSIVGRTSLFWEVQRAGLHLWLNNKGVKGQAICNYTASLSQARELLKDRPVIIGTSKMGGLPDGHIILGIGYDDINIICHDPFGDMSTSYINSNGKEVYYPDKELVKYFTNKIMYWQS